MLLHNEKANTSVMFCAKQTRIGKPRAIVLREHARTRTGKTVENRKRFKMFEGKHRLGGGECCEHCKQRERSNSRLEHGHVLPLLPPTPVIFKACIDQPHQKHTRIKGNSLSSWLLAGRIAWLCCCLWRARAVGRPALCVPW